MNAATAGAIGVILMIVMLFLGMPLSFTFAFSGVVGVALILGLDAGLTFLSTIPFTSAANYTFVVMPLFMLMGDIAFHGKLTSDAYNCARRFCLADWLSPPLLPPLCSALCAVPALPLP